MNKIPPNVMAFLKGVAKNNNRKWFGEHKEKLFLPAKREFESFVDALAHAIAKFDPAIAKGMIDPRTVKVFRIYRDARFSKNKSPYKINFGATITPGGMDGGKPGYYFHIQPGGESFVAGGLYMPTSSKLQKIREDIVKDSKKIKKILNSKIFKKYFKGFSDFVEPLKTAPRGFPKDHPEIDLLRLKSYTVGKNLSDKDIISGKMFENTVLMMKEIKKLNDYIISV